MIKKLLFGVLILMAPQFVFAYKQCPDMSIGYIFNDGSSTHIGRSGNGDLFGEIESSNPEYRTLVSIALAARASGNKVTVRFTDDEAVCGSTIWSSKIQGIGF